MASRTVTVVLQALTADYRAHMAQATASTRAFGLTALSSARQHSQAFTAIGAGALAFGGTLAFGLKTAADAAIEFESAFAGVRKTVEGTPAELQAISDGLREMATEIPVNVNELAKIAESAGQLGIEEDANLDFTRVIADLGVTTDLSTDEAASSLARLANITQLPRISSIG